MGIPISTRSDQKVPGLIVVFQCALDFPKHMYTMCYTRISATHSLKNFFSALLISKYFTEYGSVLALDFFKLLQAAVSHVGLMPRQYSSLEHH